MRVLVALLEIDRVGLTVGGRPWDKDFNLVRFFLLTILIIHREECFSNHQGVALTRDAATEPTLARLRYTNRAHNFDFLDFINR
jgi:hypothetical protein